MGTAHAASAHRTGGVTINGPMHAHDAQAPAEWWGHTFEKTAGGGRPCILDRYARWDEGLCESTLLVDKTRDRLHYARHSG